MTGEPPVALVGAAAALSLGLTDFLARFATRGLGPFLTGAGMFAVGALASAAAALWTGGPFPEGATALAFAFVSGVLGGLGILCFYLAIFLGQLAFVIPIAAAYPVWSVLYATFALGLSMTVPMALAVAATLTGAVVVARYGAVTGEGGAAGAPRALVALLAGAAGAFFIASLYVAEPAIARSSELGALALARATGAVVLVLAAALARGFPVVPRGRLVPVVVAMGLLDGFANLVFFTVIDRSDSALAIVVSSSFGVVTVLLGRLVLSERIGGRQWGGIALALGGAMAVSGLQ